MRTMRTGGLLLCVSLLIASAVPSAAEESLQFDQKAVRKTHMPHRNVQIEQSGQAAPGLAPLAPVRPAQPAQFPFAPYQPGAPVVTPTTTLPESEEHIAVDPTTKVLVTAVSDFNFAGGGINTTKYASSLDNGQTWVGESYVPMDPFGFGFLMTGDGFFWLANSDPVVAVDRFAGYVYMCNLYLDVFDNGNGLYVSVANLDPHNGVAFTAAATYPVDVHPSAFTNVLADKPWIAVDNSDNTRTRGTVYAAWSRFVGTSDSILLSRSTNHGRTWSRPIRISTLAQNGAVQGAQVAVGPSGEVYVVYEVFYTGNQRQHFLAKSTNGGGTFSFPRPITPVFTEVTFSTTYRINSLPYLTVDQRPGTANVYVVYGDQPNSSVGAEVEFVASFTGGTSFTAPVVINDVSGGHQFFPAVTVDGGGLIHAMWFDTRNSLDTTHYDIYATFGIVVPVGSQHVVQFAQNTRVTPPAPTCASTTPCPAIDTGNATFIGDYAGIAANGGFAYPVWTTGGINNTIPGADDGILQTATLQLPAKLIP